MVSLIPDGVCYVLGYSTTAMVTAGNVIVCCAESKSHMKASELLRLYPVHGDPGHQYEMEDLVCEACWSPVFTSDAIQAFWLEQSYEFEYKSSWPGIMRYADRGRNCCSFLKTVLPRPKDPMWPSEWTIDQELNISPGEARVSENVSPKGLNHCELDFGTEQLPRDLAC